jgi:spore coat protein CotF
MQVQELQQQMGYYQLPQVRQQKGNKLKNSHLVTISY